MSAWASFTEAWYAHLRFLPLLLGLRIYRHLYGFPMPQYNFVLPDEPQWPYWMAGMPLGGLINLTAHYSPWTSTGEWSSILRVQQQMVLQHFPHRYNMLNAMEYLWWIPPGPIPAKYFQPLPLQSDRLAETEVLEDQGVVWPRCSSSTASEIFHTNGVSVIITPAGTMYYGLSVHATGGLSMNAERIKFRYFGRFP